MCKNSGVHIQSQGRKLALDANVAQLLCVVYYYHVSAGGRCKRVFADSYNYYSGHHFLCVKSDFLEMRVSTRTEKMKGSNYNIRCLIRPVKVAEE